MTDVVVPFQKPTLDEERSTAQEFLDGVKSTRQYYKLQRDSLEKIRRSVQHHREGRLATFLDEHIQECDEFIDQIDESIALWQRILDVLYQKSAKP